MLRAAVALLVLGGSLAHANPPGLTPVGSQFHAPEVAPPPQPAPPAPTTYRGWTIASDLLAVALFAAAVNEDNEDLAKLSVGVYVLGAPAIHVSKNRTSQALKSVGLRVGLPVLGALLGHELAQRDCYDCGGDDEEILGGLLIGIVAASVIDAAYLTTIEPPKLAPAAWSPTVRSTQGGFAVGVGATF